MPTLIVTHSYDEAVALAERVIVLEDGHVTQTGPPTSCCAPPRRSSSPSSPGSTTLWASPAGLDVVLDSGEHVRLAEPATGRVAVLIPPWEITLAPPPAGRQLRPEPPDRPDQPHAHPRQPRARSASGPLTAEITAESSERLALKTGDTVTASFKSTAVKTIPLTDPTEGVVP